MKSKIKILIGLFFIIIVIELGFYMYTYYRKDASQTAAEQKIRSGDDLVERALTSPPKKPRWFFFKINSYEPTVGFGPTTYCLQNSCSTTELSRHIKSVLILSELGELYIRAGKTGLVSVVQPAKLVSAVYIHTLLLYILAYYHNIQPAPNIRRRAHKD